MSRHFNEQLTGNGDSETINWLGGEGVAYGHGVYDGATLTLYARRTQSEAFAKVQKGTEKGELTDVGQIVFTLGPCELKATVTNAGGSTAIDLTSSRVSMKQA